MLPWSSELTIIRFREEEKSAANHLATCSERLYPDIPSPSIPPSVPLANHTGRFHHKAYGNLIVRLDCNNAAALASSSATAEPCQLRLARGPESQLHMGGTLEHKTRDFWL